MEFSFHTRTVLEWNYSTHPKNIMVHAQQREWEMQKAVRLIWNRRKPMIVQWSLPKFMNPCELWLQAEVNRHVVSLGLQKTPQPKHRSWTRCVAWIEGHEVGGKNVQKDSSKEKGKRKSDKIWILKLLSSSAESIWNEEMHCENNINAENRNIWDLRTEQSKWKLRPGTETPSWTHVVQEIWM